MDQRQQKKGVVARANTRHRSDSRKRHRRSESPEQETKSDRDKHLKRLRKLPHEEIPKNQSKITNYKDSDKISEQSEKQNMAAPVSQEQFKMLMEEMQKINSKFDEMNMNLNSASKLSHLF